MEQHGLSACGRINCGNAARFVQIAARASEGEVIQARFTTKDDGPDVLDVKDRSLQALAHPTVFAALLRTLANLRH